jgi:dihydrofolate synthase/folylpolyglutamate synthase
MAFRSIHIGGTNGKGSVASMTASVLAEAGRRVGLYTSPHLIDFRERIRIGGRPVDQDLLERSAAQLRPTVGAVGATFFEATTALAFLCFAESDIEFVVAEVGLGGRLDATNVLLPEVAAITQVDWDHAEYLGSTLSAIAREKAGIAKPGIPLVLGRLEPEAGRTVRAVADRAGAAILQLGRDAAVRRIRVGPDATELEYIGPAAGDPIALRCPLRGAHQAWNAGIATLVLQSLPADARPSAGEIRAGIASVSCPGRLQVERRRGRTWVLDVAHNAVAVEALAQALPALGLPGPMTLALGILGDKPWPEMLPPLLAFAEVAVFTVAPSSPSERRWRPDEVAATVPGYPVEVVTDFDAALARAAEAGPTIVVTGSNYTVGDAMSRLEIPVGLPPSNRDG